jgi:hypothetical protein
VSTTPGFWVELVIFLARLDVRDFYAANSMSTSAIDPKLKIEPYPLDNLSERSDLSSSWLTAILFVLEGRAFIGADAIVL